jgi:phosphoserine phosphatase
VTKSPTKQFHRWEDAGLPTKIIVVRHGHVEGIAPPRFRGREDVPLSSLGVAQANATARHIAAEWKPSVIYTSPLARCVATGAAIAEACGVTSDAWDVLNDLDYGTWQWKTHEEIRNEFAHLYVVWHRTPHLMRFPHGESLQDLVARSGDALRRVLYKHRDRTIVLVSHDSVNRALLMQVLDQPLSAYWLIAFEPCGISEIDFNEDDVPSVARINETFHLAGIDRRQREETMLMPRGR